MSERQEEHKQPLTYHLRELRTRLIRILIAIGFGFVVCYIFKDRIFEIITKPLANALPKNSHMIYTGLPEAFFIYLKIAFFSSLFLTSPYTLYQIWGFISPGLYPSEKRYIVPFVISSTLLFVAGVLFCYFLALPPAFAFFVEFSSDFLRPMISFKEYISFSLKMLLAFGICFELPVFVFFLTKVGVVNNKMLARQRRYAILIIFIVAAILTPSPDAFSQILLALPLVILYELSIYLSKIAGRKESKDNSVEGLK
ncbi:MAG: twin-arginine translocase subunit TatC [Syntrophales bacterium]|nr:twin-arginine translocase subunit TatC [Syntrophales bacterium]